MSIENIEQKREEKHIPDTGKMIPMTTPLQKAANPTIKDCLTVAAQGAAEEKPRKVYTCDGCLNPIREGDEYFQWEDAKHCVECGTDEKEHKESIA